MRSRADVLRLGSHAGPSGETLPDSVLLTVVRHLLLEVPDITDSEIAEAIGTAQRDVTAQGVSVRVRIPPRADTAEVDITKTEVAL